MGISQISKFKIAKFLAVVIGYSLLAISSPIFAQANTGEWYIKNLNSEITVNKDSSLDITENIVADCPECAQKHGIFRTLPTIYTTDSRQKIKLPIKLISITDFSGKERKYETLKDNFNKTITWKIGDPNAEVSGENNYRIKYKVENTVRSLNQNSDELYWNLSGNQWDIPIEHFSAKIIFPESINQNNSELNIYSGKYSKTENILSIFKWNNNILTINSTETLEPGDGITASLVFPKGIITPYTPNWLEKYGNNLWYLYLIAVFVICFSLWKKYGVDPKIRAGKVPEFGPPNNFSPLYLGLIKSGYGIDSNAITAEIINLAVEKKLKITQLEKTWAFGNKDYKLELTENKKTLSSGQKELITALFGSEKSIKLSDLKNELYRKISTVSDSVKQDLEKQGLLNQPINKYIAVPILLAILSFGLIFITITIFGSWLGAVVAIESMIVAIFFAVLMPRRTKESEQMLFKIKGFKYYMETAERYRQKFNEKENIFERFLPYAIFFGITGLWLKKMQIIYGQEYINSYFPVWYVGGSMNNFNIDSFTSSLNSVSSAVSNAASSPSSSGSGGGGFSGGGGGGGGGGGW